MGHYSRGLFRFRGELFREGQERNVERPPPSPSAPPGANPRAPDTRKGRGAKYEEPRMIASPWSIPPTFGMVKPANYQAFTPSIDASPLRHLCDEP
jgi:hypothetical protein